MQRLATMRALVMLTAAGTACGGGAKPAARPTPRPAAADTADVPASTPAPRRPASAATPTIASVVPPSDPPATRSSAPPTRIGALSDANIAAIVIAANDADVSYGRLAAARSEDARVKQFAEMMQRDHGGVNALAGQLATKLRLTPQDHALSLDLRDQAEAVRDTLRELEGPALDRFYAANEVRYHANLLETMESALVPQARNRELKALLEQVLPTVRAHFRLAVQLQEQVGRR
jgi:putative membrane protein